MGDHVSGPSTGGGRGPWICASQVPMMGFMPLIIIIFPPHHKKFRKNENEELE